MARKTGLRTGELTVLRELAAGVIAAQSTTLTDANYPPAAAVDCSGLDTVLVGVEIDGGTNPTATVEALFYDPEAADGHRWRRMMLGAPPGVTPAALANENTGALAFTVNALQLVELRVFGHSKVYFRVSAVGASGSTTGGRILGMPGRVRGDLRLNRRS